MRNNYQKLKSLLISGIALGVISCSPNERIAKTATTTYLNNLIIKNDTYDLLSDVTLKDLETQQTVKCNAILSLQNCSVGFRARLKSSHRATISWSQKGVTYTGLVQAQNHAQKFDHKTLSIVIAIQDSGKHVVWYEKN